MTRVIALCWLGSDSMRAHNESLRCWTDKIKWIARHKRQDRLARLVQHRRVLRCDHHHRVHAIPIRSIERRQRNLVVLADIAERSEERVTVSRDRDVPVLAG